jgi:guanylate kinase
MKELVKKNKAIVVSAPSGAGKTTLVRHLLVAMPVLEFSVSAASRQKRDGETDGKDYYFITADDFRSRISKDEFVEWEEVYPGSYYGTLKSELERIWQKHGIPIFDVDVIGGLNLKKYFGDAALAIFIQPPSIEILGQRLYHRGTESEESLKNRLSKAEYELGFAPQFDTIIVNDNLETKCAEIVTIVSDFLDLP